MNIVEYRRKLDRRRKHRMAEYNRITIEYGPFKLNWH